MDEIVNKVAESGLITINLEDFYPEGERILFDIKPWLFQEIILKEKDFREHIKNHDWNIYQNKFVALTCTADAIIPTWAYMLIAAQLSSIAKKIVFGDLKKLEEEIFHDAFQKLNPEEYRDQRIILKGCSNKEVPASAYVEFTNLLRPFVKSIMYGEACSTVPVYKKK
jgi:hypothetical protein